MKTIRRGFAVLFLLGACAAGQQMVFEIDPEKSWVEFTLGATMHTVHGTFRVKSGQVQFDAASAAARGEIVVDATSGDSGSKGRDKKMHREVLESAKYPEIRFTARQFRGTVPANGTAQVQIAGVLTLHGSDHPFTATAPVQVTEGRVSAGVHFEIPYVAWGLKDPSTFVLRVDKKVDIVVHAVGTVTPGPVAATH